MVTGVEEIVTIIVRYTQIEKLYQSRAETALKQDFDQHLVPLYKHIIRYQISATCYYQRNTMRAPSKPTHTHWTVTRSINTLFTGRSELLAKLEDIARGAVNDSSRHDQCRVVITGIGGQGKSEICLQLAHRVRQA
ncbi:MAG: hypothetical protein OHK93_005243 [Ramalina farinacea]|uniref:Uncharacterized protein n=1 Tax=Ramalina farinacea TaxID=258253 RepID=A0AA43QVP3_9LECA|nr:hypothetical protein [Ramalina farinacea]